MARCIIIKMFKQRLVPVFLLISAIAALPANPTNAELQVELDGLVSRLKQSNATTDTAGNVVVLPPTFSLDMWSLLRLAVQQEVNTQLNKEGVAKSAKLSNNVQASYPTTNLDLLNLGNRTYFMPRNQQLTWMDAVTFCRMYGMDIVSVETKEEDDLIVNYLQSIGLKHDNVVHMSGNKIGRSTYVWINGKPLIYANWGPGQPAHFNDRNCIGYHGSTWGRWYWIDYPCTIHERYVMCELP